MKKFTSLVKYKNLATVKNSDKCYVFGKVLSVEIKCVGMVVGVILGSVAHNANNIFIHFLGKQKRIL